MICCYFDNSITQEQLDIDDAHLLVGRYSHTFCDNKYFKRQEKKVKYIKNRGELI